MNHRFQQLHPPQRVRAHAAAAFLLLGLIGPGAAERAHANISWSNAAGGNFSHGPNWTGGTAPTGGDTAVFDLPGPYTVTFDQPTADPDSDKLRVDAGEVAFDFADPSYTHTIGNTSTLDPGLRIGFPTMTPSPKLTLAGGGTLNAGHTIVGDDALGELIVDGPGTKLKGLRSGQGVVVGHGATGNMTVRNGAIVDVNKATLGASSQGNAGFGHALITGPQSQWSANTLNFTSGEMVVEAGGGVATGIGGLDNGSRLTIRGADSRFDANSSLAGNAFNFPDGRVDVLDGGEVYLADSHYFGLDGGSHESLVIVAGSDGQGNASRLYALGMTIGSHRGGGSGGKSFMDVHDGGHVETKFGVAMSNKHANGLTSLLSVTGAGSRFEITNSGQDLAIAGSPGSGNANTGNSDSYVTVADGGVVRADGVVVWHAGRLSGNGTVDADLTNHGHVSPSMRYHYTLPTAIDPVLDATRGPASEMTIEGDYEQSAGATLDILLDDAAFDRLLITDDALLDGG